MRQVSSRLWCKTVQWKGLSVWNQEMVLQLQLRKKLWAWAHMHFCNSRTVHSLTNPRTHTMDIPPGNSRSFENSLIWHWMCPRRGKLHQDRELGNTVRSHGLVSRKIWAIEDSRETSEKWAKTRPWWWNKIYKRSDLHRRHSMEQLVLADISRTTMVSAICLPINDDRCCSPWETTSQTWNSLPASKYWTKG